MKRIFFTLLIVVAFLVAGCNLNAPIGAPSATDTPNGAQAPCVTILEDETITILQGETVERVLENGYVAVITCNGDKVTITYREPTGTPSLTPTTVPPTAVPPSATTVVSANWPTNLFRSPIPQTAVFNAETAWIIAEPGVICNPECPWTILATKDTWYGNASEGGFLYISAGQIVINADSAVFNLQYQEGNNYLVVVRGRIDDAKINTDRNLSVAMSDFVPGHAIFSTMPNGAYVSMDWFRDQLHSSMNVQNATSSKTNCGALGCTQTTVLLFDVDSHYYQIWKILATDLSNWTLLESGTK